jgi:hypothetical protein
VPRAPTWPECDSSGLDLRHGCGRLRRIRSVVEADCVTCAGNRPAGTRCRCANDCGDPTWRQSQSHRQRVPVGSSRQRWHRRSAMRAPRPPSRLSHRRHRSRLRRCRLWRTPLPHPRRMRANRRRLPPSPLRISPESSSRRQPPASRALDDSCRSRGRGFRSGSVVFVLNDLSRSRVSTLRADHVTLAVAVAQLVPRDPLQVGERLCTGATRNDQVCHTSHYVQRAQRLNLACEDGLSSGSPCAAIAAASQESSLRSGDPHRVCHKALFCASALHTNALAGTEAMQCPEVRSTMVTSPSPSPNPNPNPSPIPSRCRAARDRYALALGCAPAAPPRALPAAPIDRRFTETSFDTPGSCMVTP